MALSDTATRLDLRRLAPSIGAEVVGLDLRQPIDAPTAAALRQAWYDHGVLLVRGQDITEDQQARYGEVFGPLALAHASRRMPDHHPSVMLISNIRENGKPIGALPDGEMFFHSDLCYTEHPVAGTMLYSVEVPRQGGNTLFADQYAAYETLPQAVKARIDGKRATNRYEIGYDVTIRRGRAAPDAPAWTHPMVRVHPQTGRRALYINRLMTHDIEGMDASEAEPLLDQLYDHQEQRRFVYEHVWRVGDVILWDNRCTLHARTDFSPSERRLLKRITIARDIDG
ncbi:MAG TPA: TauD/TfdA family dioxygenase [Stellaceae bacterium]|nr:TauD/TfdA family dioxygenase [Stellaceae bacterium]